MTLIFGIGSTLILAGLGLKVKVVGQRSRSTSNFALRSGSGVEVKVKCVVHRGLDPVPVFQGPKMRKNGFLSRGQGQWSRSS